MRSTLRYLTDGDLGLLLEKSQRLGYQPDEVIIAEGSRRQALFVLREGHVRVELPGFGTPVVLTTLGPGEVFGEMSFIDDRGASASVIADDEAEVDVIEGDHVQALLFSTPGLAARFFYSLAVTLSHRLRETSAQVEK
jgi:CRP-like cAMP-binding protein